MENIESNKYYPVGTKLQYCNNVIEVIESSEYDSPCDFCALSGSCSNILCAPAEREDKTNVLFLYV